MFKRLAFAATLAGALALGVAAPALAAKAKYEFDKSHTHINFTVSHLGFSQTVGAFKEFDGTISFDPKKPEKTSLNVTISAASIDSAWAKRDEHLRGADFFNVEKFPTLTFVSKSVEVTGEKTAKLTGDFTMLGVTKPVTLEVTMNGMGEHPFRKGTQVAGFSATGKLNRSEFGMAYGVPAIGDEVTIYIETELNSAAK